MTAHATIYLTPAQVRHQARTFADMLPAADPLAQMLRMYAEADLTARNAVFDGDIEAAEAAADAFTIYAGEVHASLLHSIDYARGA